MWDDLEHGRGTEKQVEAYRELEWRRCSRDPVYFVDKYGWLVDKATGTIFKFHLWPIQRTLLTEWQQHLSTVAVKARQLGVTTLSAHFALWEVLFKEAAKWLLVSASEEKAKDIIDRIQATKDRMPQWMIERAQSRKMSSGPTRRKDRSDALMRLSFGHSEMKVVTSTSKSIKGAAANFILDEFTEHDEQERKWRMLLPAIDGGAMAIIIANGEGEDIFFHIYQRAKASQGRFRPHFFWWGDDPRRLEDATIDGKPALEFTKRDQLKAMAEGRLDSPWYVRMEDEFLLSNPEADKFAFKQQFPSTEQEAFYLSGNSRFSLELLNEMALDIHARQIHPRHGLIEKLGEKKWSFRNIAKGTIRMYEEPIAGAKYVIGVDSAGGAAAGDYSVIQCFKVDGNSLVQCAVLQTKITPAHLAYEVEKLGWYYNEAFVTVESNFHGQVVRDRLKEGYTNLYMRKRYEKFSDDEVDTIGFWTDANSKLRIIDQLDEWLHEKRLVINDSQTIAELSHYEVRDNGTTGAPKGMTDDLVMALALAIEGAVDALLRKTYEPIILNPYGRAS